MLACVERCDLGIGACKLSPPLSGCTQITAQEHVTRLARARDLNAAKSDLFPTRTQSIMSDRPSSSKHGSQRSQHHDGNDSSRRSQGQTEDGTGSGSERQEMKEIKRAPPLPAVKGTIGGIGTSSCFLAFPQYSVLNLR